MATQTHKKRELLTYGFLLVIFLGLALAYPALATEYKPLVGVPGLPNDGTRTLSGYVNIVYLLTISIGALIAFLKITIAGVKYSMSDVITDKGEAKKEIMGALFGLAILLIPFLVLNTIYGGLININILDEARPVNVSTSPTGSPGGVQVGGNQTFTIRVATCSAPMVNAARCGLDTCKASDGCAFVPNMKCTCNVTATNKATAISQSCPGGANEVAGEIICK